MNSKYLTWIALIFFVILGWNMFLIQRDQKLFDAYDACVQSKSTCPYNK